MTTSAVTSTLQHTDDATFRAWGRQVGDQLTAVGLVRTADTGQINWGTVLRPAANASAGFEIFRFDDPLQATRPIFIRINYFTSSTATNPFLQISTGQGTDGAGALTSVMTGNVNVLGGGGPANTATVSYACMNAALGGFFFAGWLGSRSGVVPNAAFTFGIFRSLDDNGAPTGDGFTLYFAGNGPLTSVSWSWLTNSGLNSGQSYTIVPGNIASSSFGTDIQAYRHYMSYPIIRPLAGLVTVFASEITRGSTFTATILGATARTYLALGDGVIGASSNNAQSHSVAMNFE